MLSSIGVDWASWTEMQGVTVDNGAIFWMSPDDGPTSSDADGQGPGLVAGKIVVAQITLLETQQLERVETLTLNAQGRTTAPAAEAAGDAPQDVNSDGSVDGQDLLDQLAGFGGVATPVGTGATPVGTGVRCSELQRGVLLRCDQNCGKCKIETVNIVLAGCAAEDGSVAATTCPTDTSRGDVPDTNGDGVADVADLLSVLAAFGAPAAAEGNWQQLGIVFEMRPTPPTPTPSAVPAAVCRIDMLFEHLTRITTDPNCRAGCAGGVCPEEW
jgi:hypothetical protein